MEFFFRVDDRFSTSYQFPVPTTSRRQWREDPVLHNALGSNVIANPNKNAYILLVNAK